MLLLQAVLTSGLTDSDSCQLSLSLSWKRLFPAELETWDLGVQLTGRSEFLSLKSSRRRLPMQLYRETLAQGVMWKALRCCCPINEHNLRARDIESWHELIFHCCCISYLLMQQVWFQIFWKKTWDCSSINCARRSLSYKKTLSFY